MHRIIQLFRRYNFLIFFLFLEMMSLSVFVHYHKYQEALLENTLINVRGGLNSFFSYFSDFFYLKSENERLLEENTRLRNILLTNFEKVPEYALMKSDTIMLENVPYFRKYTMWGAKVVAAHLSLNNNTFQILIGAKNGIRKDMGVVTSNGVAGFVTNVSDYYAEVLSILNQSYKISAMHKRSDFIGIIEWDGKNLHEMLMKNLPYTANVAIGDTIYTSQYSEKFPPYSVIGTVSKIEKQNIKNSYNIRVHLTMDFTKLTYVYVIDNLIETDRKNLIQSSTFLSNESAHTEE